MDENLIKFQEFAEKLAYDAGEVIRSGFSMEIVPDWKADGTPLTETDKKINQMVIDRVKSEFGDHDVMAEEGNDMDSAEYLWVCDPVDGTIPFSHGLKMSTFSLALVKDGTPIVGVVNDPFTGLLFSASVGNGCLMNGEKVEVSKSSEIRQSLVIVEGPAPIINSVLEVTKRGGHVMKLASFVYGAKQIASGHFGGAIFGWTSPWDAAAVKVLVEEAGGKTSDLDGNDQRYDRETNGFVVSNGLLHEELLEIVELVKKDK